MRKTVSPILFVLAVVVISAMPALGEPNYPPPGPDWLWDMRAISYGWAGGTGQWLGKTPEEYEADANAIASNGYNTVVLFGRQDRLGSIQEWPDIIEELDELVTIFHQHGLRVFDHQSCGLVEANDINVPIPDTNSTICDLLQIDAQTFQPSFNPDWNVYNVCHINPLTPVLIAAHNYSIFTLTAVDGLMSDDIGFAEYSCVCPYCRAKAIQDCGFDVNNYIPVDRYPGSDFWFNRNSDEYRCWNRFHQNSVGDHYVQMQKLFAGIRPGIGLMACMAVTIDPAFSQYCGGSLEQVGRGANLLMHEDIPPAYFTEWQFGTAAVKRAQSLGRISDRPVLNLQYSITTRDEFFSGATPAEVVFTWALDKTFGCRSWVNDPPASIGQQIKWEVQHTCEHRHSVFDSITRLAAPFLALYSAGRAADRRLPRLVRIPPF
jgi:hypothetical protein